MLRKIINLLFQLLPIKKNKVLFYGYYGAQYGCSPKYISQYITHNEVVFDQVWAILDEDTINDSNIKKVKFASLQFLYEWATSGFIITNYRLPIDLKKKKGQIYIQTWHSSLRLKKIEKDAEEHLPMIYVNQAKLDSPQIDYLISGCEDSTVIFKRSFWYDGAILKVGTPRIDPIMKPILSDLARIRRNLGIKEGDKTVLYAPTFRKGDDYSCYITDFSAILQALTLKFGGNWKVLIRLHPHLFNKEKDVYSTGDFISATKYPDIQELLMVADFLITDYSSLMFDFMFSKKPVMLYVPDLDFYLANERELYYSVDELPFIVVKESGNLSHALVEFDASIYLKGIDSFIRAIGSYEEGHASEKIVNLMKNNL